MSSQTPESCRICGGTEGHRRHVAREMMFGLGHAFTYLECGRCGCVQLIDVPSDMAAYYPPEYGAFATHGPLKARVLVHLANQAYRGRDVIGIVLEQVFGPDDAMVSVRRAGLSKRARILDIGCGAGRLIRDMRALGFLQVEGVDAYIPTDMVHPNGARVHKRRLQETTGRFDVVMMHHSFEHMDHPASTLQRVADLLEPGGLAIVRIPVASSWAWRHYGVSWMHLDAPRHLFLHTRESMGLLAATAGLVVEGVVDEGNESQFLGSEQYRMGIPLIDRRSFLHGRLHRLRRWREFRSCHRRAEELNRRGEGDWACFYLRKATDRDTRG